MYRKPSILMLTTGSLLAGGVGAQQFKDVNLFSSPGCGDDLHDLDVLTHELSFSPKVGGQYKDAQWSDCYQSTMKEGGWPHTDEGKYAMYVDTSDLAGDCFLHFYATHPGTGFACQNKVKSLSKTKNTCPMVPLGEGFGYA